MTRILNIEVKSLPDGKFKRWAHHPHCNFHINHLLWIGGNPLCLGCTCMYSGIALGTIFSGLIMWSEVSFWTWMIFDLALLIPTLLQLKVQNKLFKIVSRLTLGIAIAIYFWGGIQVHPPIFSQFILICVLPIPFLTLYTVISRMRKRSNKSPCNDCPLGRYPICEWNVSQILIETDTDFQQIIGSGSLNEMVKH